MILKALDQIQISDIQSLVDDTVRESATLEYKQAVHGNKESEIREFLADVSSFANSKGGDIVYGIAEKKDEAGKNTGVADNITPLIGLNSDQLTLQLEQSVRSSISPRMKIQIKQITGFGEDGQGAVLIIRIPKSLAGPHMVSYQQSSKFYARTSAGKYLLDIREIRDAFLATESQGERIRQFRLERISNIMADDTPVTLSSPQRFILHVIPIGSFLNREILDLASPFHHIKDHFVPICGLHGISRFNLDGILNWHDRNSGYSHGYCQLFSDGTVETVVSNNFYNRHSSADSLQSAGGIHIDGMEYQVVESIRKIGIGYDILKAQGPFVAMVSILGCKGYWNESQRNLSYGHRLESNVINFREVVLESLENDIEMSLKPLFNQFWNAFGHSRSYSYDQNGNWIRG